MVTQGINLKHLDVRRDKLLYRRRIPKDLISVCGKTTWYRQLQCKVDASDSEIVEAWNEAHKSFETMVKLTRSNFSKEISEERQTRDALRYLDFFKLKSGELSQAHQTYGLDPWELEPKAFRPLCYGKGAPSAQDLQLRAPASLSLRAGKTRSLS